MNREIKFRGKRTDNGEWIYGNFVRPNYIVTYINKNELLETEIIEINPKTVGQFIEICDKNGNEIYGGSIAQTVCENLKVRLSKFEYFWNEDKAQFQKRREDGNIYACDKISEGGKEIIGNIYENNKNETLEKYVNEVLVKNVEEILAKEK